MTDIILAGVGTILGMFWLYLMIKGRKARNTESIPFLPFVFPVGLGVLFL